MAVREREESAVEIDGRRVRITNAGKVLWPSTGFTKGDLVEYYRRVAPVLLPHVGGRALTLARYPDGVDGPGWFQSNCPAGRPPWIRVASMQGRRGQPLRPCVVDDLASLLWVANTGAIELHPLLATVDRPDVPRELVLDLDPTPPADLLACARLALAARQALAAQGLSPRIKTSGWAGVHVVAPLDGSAGFAWTRELARATAEGLAARFPGLATARMPRSERAGKVLVDWRQNAPRLSTAAAYSLRATPRPQVSTPLRWTEVERAVAQGDAAALVFGPEEVLARVAAGDGWGEGA